MAKTYNTISTFTSGQVFTAAQMNEIGTNSNNYRVPPMCEVYRSSTLTPYTSGTDIVWNAERYDTDGMWASGAQVTIQTAGIYMITLSGEVAGTATLSGAVTRIVNGANIISSARVGWPNAATNVRYCITTIAQCAIGDLLSARVLPEGGSNYTIPGSAVQVDSAARFAVTWLGQSS